MNMHWHEKMFLLQKIRYDTIVIVFKIKVCIKCAWPLYQRHTHSYGSLYLPIIVDMIKYQGYLWKVGFRVYIFYYRNKNYCTHFYMTHILSRILGKKVYFLFV